MLRRTRREQLRAQGGLVSAREAPVVRASTEHATRWAASTAVSLSSTARPAAVPCPRAHRHTELSGRVIEGALTGEIFLAYVEQLLFPTLRRNDIVVMGNFRAHKLAGIQQPLRKRMRRFATCRSTRPTSISSSCRTANSKPCCARSRRGLFGVCTAQFARSCPSSVLKNAPTTSGMPTMLQYERNPL
jgi:hypothetical protein